MNLELFIYFSVKEDALTDMALHMTDGVGLVQQMPYTCDREGFVSHLEKVTFSPWSQLLN